MYVGFVLYENLEFIVVVVLENVGGGSLNVVFIVCIMMDEFFCFNLDVIKYLKMVKVD